MRKIFLIGLLVQLASCNLEPSANKESYALLTSDTPNDERPEESGGEKVAQQRMLIKTGNLSMRVEDLIAARTQIGKITSDFGAYLSEERLDNYGDRINISITIRIPSPQYDTLIVLIEKVGNQTDAKSVNVLDVTEEYIDIEARLKTKKELETRYREILKKASTVNDILAVENQLNNVRGEIESMEGRLKYLTSQVSFSTLHLTFYQSIDSDFGFADQLADGLENGWINLLSFVIGLANVWPFLIILSGGIWGFISWRKRKTRLAA